MEEVKKYLLDIGFDDAHLPELFNDDDKSTYTVPELMKAYTDHKLKLLGIANVSGSLLTDLDYWKQRCELAEKCLEQSPCDPDITSEQIKAYNAYNKFISNFGNDR